MPFCDRSFDILMEDLVEVRSLMTQIAPTIIKPAYGRISIILKHFLMGEQGYLV
ncbi:MAG: hypothetical protein AB4426_04055 [Xenococcaceae cyanobacterium]